MIKRVPLQRLCQYRLWYWHGLFADIRERDLGMKLRYRLFFVYIFGGTLPIIVIGLYLVHGISSILIGQAKSGEVVAIERTKRQIEEVTETVSTVTKYFYFDPHLERIASKQYTDYVELVQEYKEFTSFLDYTRYYNNTIAWINIHMENHTIVENSRFIPVTEEMAEEEWYQSAVEKNGGALWRFRQLPSVRENSLSMIRMLKTKKGENVGVLSVYIRPERFLTFLQDRDCAMFLVLNGDTVVSDCGDGIEFAQICEKLSDKNHDLIQENIFLGRQEYVMTCDVVSLAESQDYLQIVSVRSYQDILSEVYQQIARSICFFALSAVLSVIIILVFSHSFGSRVERFRAQMEKVAGGSFELVEKLGGNDEISSLYDYLGTMILQIQRLLSEVYREKLHAERLTIQQKDAEFKMLASQINPHFLYNTLETIRMRARKSKQYDIEELVKMLAKIMRSTLKAGNNEVTIWAEAELVEYYLKIQQYRFGDRIQYYIQVAEELKELYILPLLMQPIVENSIIHGLESKEGAGKIDLTIFNRDDRVVISIVDNGMGMSEEKLEQLKKRLNSYNEKGKHIGVSNVHQRVKLKYGNHCGVEIDSVEGSFTRVEILLPSMEELKGGELCTK